MDDGENKIEFENYVKIIQYYNRDVRNYYYYCDNCFKNKNKKYTYIDKKEMLSCPICDQKLKEYTGSGIKRGLLGYDDRASMRVIEKG